MGTSKAGFDPGAKISLIPLKEGISSANIIREPSSNTAVPALKCTPLKKAIGKDIFCFENF